MAKISSGQIQYQATYTAPGSGSQWKGVAAGNFDNTGKDEIVALRNGMVIYLYINMLQEHFLFLKAMMHLQPRTGPVLQPGILLVTE